jgi:predicted nucleotidyltransferase
MSGCAVRLRLLKGSGRGDDTRAGNGYIENMDADRFHSPVPSIDDIGRAGVHVGAGALRLVVLFGSTARGEPSPADLDIGVLADHPVDTIDFTNRFIQELHFQGVDLTDLRTADPLLQILAARDGIPLFEAVPGEFDRFCSLAARRYADTAKFREMERDRVRDFVARHRNGE